MLLLLLAPGGAVVIALLASGVARWAWAAAALLAGVWLAATGAVVEGLLLSAGSVAATVLEDPTPSRVEGFNGLMWRLAAIVVGTVGGLLLVVRALAADPAQQPELFVALAIGLAVTAHLLGRPGAAEEARAARASVAVLAAAWMAGGHASTLTALAAAAMGGGLAMGARWLRQA